MIVPFQFHRRRSKPSRAIFDSDDDESEAEATQPQPTQQAAKKPAAHDLFDDDSDEDRDEGAGEKDDGGKKSNGAGDGDDDDYAEKEEDAEPKGKGRGSEKGSDEEGDRYVPLCTARLLSSCASAHNRIVRFIVGRRSSSIGTGNCHSIDLSLLSYSSHISRLCHFHSARKVCEYRLFRPLPTETF